MDIPSYFSDGIIWSLSVFSGIIMCKIVYDITEFASSLYSKAYNNLRKIQKIEWNNRAFSSFHAILVSAVSFHLLILSDLYKDDYSQKFIIERTSFLSKSILGISTGYFLSDLAMILWLFPALGGKEYIIHHGFSLLSMTLALVSGSAHFYIIMVLFSEVTTPFVNLRWYLDRADKKDYKIYLYNGAALFLGWLIARVLLFVYFFTHLYLHFDQAKTIFSLGFYNLLITPSLLAMMNVYWFWKITKGLIKNVSKTKHV
ncbi:Transmembrane protein 56 [Zostera marina]|uniref:Transmembrane protein 56 n=1 Tax=Zostera marina TaxID=29655 RepID=A0A0K9PRJ5_ZOSMR|nr:Transmembrane protein 56 [Zostera marina]